MTDYRETSSERESGESDGETQIDVTRGPIDEPQTGPRNRRPRGGPRHGSEHDLADELGRIDVKTTPEGYVEGRITDLTAVDATTIGLTIALPHGESVAFELDKPIPWSNDFLLSRLVEDIGYDAASIDHIVGEPVYLVRTDPDTEQDWRSASLQTATDVLVSSLSGGRYRLEPAADPQWRLVDPLERPAATETDATDTTRDRPGVGLVLLGTIVAAIGAVVGATGDLVVSAAMLGGVAIGLLVVLFGLVVLLREERTA